MTNGGQEGGEDAENQRRHEDLLPSLSSCSFSLSGPDRPVVYFCKSASAANTPPSVEGTVAPAA